jgi:curli production assembly/transport component CsgE
MLVCLGMLSMAPSHGQENGISPLEDEIGGLVVDSTITRTGHDFFRYMSGYKNSAFPDATYNLTVHERPSARWGSLIWITSDQKTLFRQFIQPSHSDLRSIAEMAAIQANEQIQKLKLQALFSDTFDIDRDEI